MLLSCPRLALLKRATSRRGRLYLTLSAPTTDDVNASGDSFPLEVGTGPAASGACNGELGGPVDHHRLLGKFHYQGMIDASWLRG